MERLPVDKDDVALFELAAGVLAQRYSDERHRVACALRTGSGQLFTGVSVTSRRTAVCAEHVALGAALTAGDADVRMVVAVARTPTDPAAQVVSPCGVCREMLLDLCPQACVLVDLDAEVMKVRVGSLLPARWIRPTESGRVLGPPAPT